jgi:hypothetical protein
VCLCVRVCVCACVCEKEREKERDRERKKERGARERNATIQNERSKIVEEGRRLRVLVHRRHSLRHN